MSKYVSLSCSFKKTVLQKKPGVILEGESVGTWESRVELLKRRPEGVGGGGGGLTVRKQKLRRQRKKYVCTGHREGNTADLKQKRDIPNFIV